MNELQQVLNDIKQDKNTNLLPGNLRDNVTCLGIEGTAEVPEPIYTTTDYRTVNIPSPSSQYTEIYHLYRLDSYLIVSWKKGSYGSNYYLYKKDIDGYTLLGDTNCGTRTSYYGCPVILGYNDKYVYVIQAQRNSDYCYVYPFNLDTNMAESTISEYQSTSIADFVYSQKDGYAISSRTGSGYLFKLNMNENPVTLDRLIQIPNNSYVYNKHQLIFGYSHGLTKVNISDSSTVTTKIMDKRIYGVNYYGTKVFFEDGIYQLSEQLTVSQKLGEINIPTTSTQPIYPFNEKYYVRYNTTDNKATIYEFNEDTNLFTELETVNSGDISGYEQSPDLYYGNYVYDFIQGDTLIGYTVDGNNLYINADRSITTSSILNGYQAYNSQGNPIVGTMPNNGELNITPTTENQNIPEGYTSGGTVLGDENLKSENIKKDVSIFGVTGSLESSSGEVKLFETVEEMQADETAKEGDLAVVYKYKFNNIVAETRYDVVYFPEVVVLNARVESPITIGNIFFKPYIRITSTVASFTMSGYTVTYTSEDGITYTRTDTLGNPLEGIYMSSSNWNDIIGYFVKTLEIYFGGVFRHNGEQYVDAPNQLTLNDASYLLTNISGYGPNGIVTGDDSIYTKLSTSKLDEYYANKYGATNEDKYLHPSITGITGINLKVIKKSNDSLNTLENGKYCNCNTIEVPLQYDNVLTNFFFSNKDFIFTVVAYTENDVQSLIVNKYNNALTLLETYTLEFPYTIKNCVLHNELLYIVYYDNSSKFRISVYNIQTQSEIQSQDLITTTSLANVILAYDEIAQLLYITTQIDSSNNNLYRYSYVNNSIETIFSTTGSNMEGGYASTCGTSSKHIYVTKGNTLYYYVKGSTTQTELLTLTNMSCTRELYSIEYNGIIYLAVGGCDSYSAGMNSVGNIYQLNDDMTYSLLYNGNSNYSLDILEINGNPCYCRDQYGYLDKSNWFTGSISEMDYVFPLATTTRKNIYVNNNILTIGWNSKTEINGYYTFNYVDTSSDINSLINLQNGDKSYVPVYCYASAKTKPLFDVSWNTLYNGSTNYDGTISPTEYNTALETSK